MFKRQYDIITKDRGKIETFVVGTLLKDLSLYMDFKLKDSDFIIDKTKFFFGLGRIASKTLNELDELSLYEIVNKDRDLRDRYKEYGGWETVKKAMEFGNSVNMEAYVDELYKNNFLIKRGKKEIFTKTIETDGIEVNPWKDLFPDMTCREDEEYFIGDLAKDAVATINNNIKGESVILRSDDLNKLQEGINQGIPYDVIFEYTEKEIGLSDDETPKFVYASPWLSKNTNGMGDGGGVTIFSGWSGLGKSTYMFLNMVLPMIYRNCPTAIYSNEQKIIYFQSLLYSFIAANVFKYYKLTRSKIENGEFNEEERELMLKISDFLDRRNFDEMLIYYQLEEFDVDEIIRISKGLISHQGMNCFLIDTFKSEDSSDAQYVGKMIEATKKLDNFGNKFNCKVMLTMQLTPGNEGAKAYLTASDLMECKSVKTVADCLFMMRSVVKELELDPSNKKYYLQPYKVVKKKRHLPGESAWKEEEITFTERELEYDYRLIFLNKNRRGKSDLIMLMRFNSQTGKFDEIGLCKRCYRGTLSQ